jgi:glutamine amidotransferase
MCRLVSYLGRPVTLSDILVQPANSLVMQSLHAKESETRTNGDGFGVGWYAPMMDEKPGLFTSVSPAWNDRNLLSLTKKIQSPAFFAHVRAASAGGVTQYNCHPFVHNNWMMMHNGGISGFKQIKRHLRRLLDDDLYDWIQGETDSEHLFALFLQHAKTHDLSQIKTVAAVLKKTIQDVLGLVQQFGGASHQKPSHFNVCLTDGKRLIATRYCSDKACTPRSLHYAIGSQFLMQNGQGEMLPSGEKKSPACVLVSSEKLTQSSVAWQAVPPQHMLLVTAGLDVKLEEF